MNNTTNRKIETLKLGIKYHQENTGRCHYKDRPLGCPMYTMMDSKLTKHFTKEELQLAFFAGLIGNNGHDGTIFKNCKDISI